MPTYEYECEKCGHRFDQFQMMTDDPLTHCPKCGGTVRRLIGRGAAVIFKGKGFHATDYPSTRPACGRNTTCCGRSTPCDTPPCDE